MLCSYTANGHYACNHQGINETFKNKKIFKKVKKSEDVVIAKVTEWATLNDIKKGDVIKETSKCTDSSDNVIIKENLYRSSKNYQQFKFPAKFEDVSSGECRFTQEIIYLPDLNMFKAVQKDGNVSVNDLARLLNREFNRQQMFHDRTKANKSSQ